MNNALRRPAPELSPRTAAALGARATTIPPTVKAAVAHLMAFNEKSQPDEIADREYAGDIIVKNLTRSNTAVASQATVTALSMTGAPSEYLGGLAADAAGLTLLASEGTLQLKFGTEAKIDIATVSALATGAGYVLEANAGPVHQYEITAPELVKKKFLAISVFRREIFAHSRPALEQIVKSSMRQDINAAFDKALLDASAGTTTRPAGLRYNISENATGASTATVLSEAMATDLQTVISAVSAVASNGPIIIVAAPPQAVALRLRQRSNFDYPILSSSGLDDGMIMAVAANCLISAIDPTPKFTVSDQGVVHLDTAPSQLSMTGTPVAVPYPVISLFQADALALRVTFDVAYTLRHASGLSWLSVSW